MIGTILFYTAFSLTIILVIIKFIVSLTFFKIYLNSKENKLILGASILFLFYAIARIIFLIFDFSLTGFDSNLYQDYALVWKIGFLATTLGLLSIIFISEIAILKKKSRFLISIFYLLSVILVLIPQDIQTVQIISIIPSAIAMIYIPLSYLYLARYKAIRKRALSIFAGFFIFFAGTAIHTEDKQ
jgi:hypothetical protein